MTDKQSHQVIMQSRWRVVNHGGTPHLLYYGVRNPPRQREVLLPISALLAEQIESHHPVVSGESDEVQALEAQGVLVKASDRRSDKTPESMQTCTNCVNNDFVVPGLEFNDDGLCALCQCYASTGTTVRSAFVTISEDELLSQAKTNTQSRFDAMVFYTGGKDSSYTLWLLARKLKLRVLAAFWNMPYCSDAAYENIRRAKKAMPEVEFVEWTLPQRSVLEAMRVKWRMHGWPCLCPTAAFPTLYPLAASLRIPFVFLGLEDVQAAVLDYVISDPEVERPVMTLRDQTLAFLSARALPNSQKPPFRWPDEMANYHAAVRGTMPTLFSDLENLVKQAKADPTLSIPLIGRLSTNTEYGSWNSARELIEKEMDWRGPEGQKSLLHTSCAIEPVKDYLQFQRFKKMRTVFMPQSIVELSAAVFFGLTSREDALVALKELGYWKPPPILDRLAADLELTKDKVATSNDELLPGMAEWAGIEQ